VPRPLTEQVVVITGASSGIGRSTARLLAARWARVVVTARRADALEELVAEIERDGGRAVAVPGDVTREEDLRAVARAAVERFGRIDNLDSPSADLPRERGGWAEVGYRGITARQIARGISGKALVGTAALATTYAGGAMVVWSLAMGAFASRGAR
jgi:NAD(P)-dependent dehydrogenase (short-subunit alcohol dehydrogenase family)